MVFMGGISVRQARSRWTEFTEFSKYDQMGSIHPARIRSRTLSTVGNELVKMKI